MTTYQGALLAGIIVASILVLCWEGRGRLKNVPGALILYFAMLALANTEQIPRTGRAYEVIDSSLPLFVLLSMASLDIGRIRSMVGKSVAMMLVGIGGVALGGVVVFWAMRSQLPPFAPLTFAGITGTWVGGTANMMGAMAMYAGNEIDASMPGVGPAQVTDTILCYLLWFPALVWIARVGRNRRVRDAGDVEIEGSRSPLRIKVEVGTLAIGIVVVMGASALSKVLPGGPIDFRPTSWLVVLVSLLGLGVSLTPLSGFVRKTKIATLLLVVFLASKGAQATLSEFSSLGVFLIAGSLWLVIHALCLAIGARVLKETREVAIIASASAIGGLATAPVVAASCGKEFVPLSVGMATLGYAMGNFVGFVVGRICEALA